jgi:hypothetical protein
MTGLERVRRRQRVPVVPTREEVKAALSLMEGTCRLMAELMHLKEITTHYPSQRLSRIRHGCP